MVGSPGNISSLLDIAVVSLCYVSKADAAPDSLWLCSVCTVWDLSLQYNAMFYLGAHR